MSDKKQPPQTTEQGKEKEIQKDILEEDDEFEEFEDETWTKEAEEFDKELQWVDDWDDELQFDDNFSKQLRAELQQ